MIKIGDIVQFNHWDKSMLLFTHTGFIAKKYDKSAFDWIAVSFLTEEEVYLNEEWIKTCMCNDI
jgi:predicted molibdopterin-dependent oxidoreductase YjgC